MLSEAQMLRQPVAGRSAFLPAHYLDNGLWGKDRLWDELVRHAFTVFLCLLPAPGGAG